MNGTGKKELLERGMNDDEAERVLDRAARLMSEREGEGRHSKDDLKSGAAEVGIDPALVDEAMRQLAAEERARRERKRRHKRAALVIVAAVTVLVGGGALFTHGTLNDKLADVEKRQAQLENVLARRRALVPELLSLARAQALSASQRAHALEALIEKVENESDLPSQLAADREIADSLRALHEVVARDASPGQQTLVLRVADEMAGAHNRIAVERKRYDEAASEYNRAARSLPTAWLLPFTGLPESVPLSKNDG